MSFFARDITEADDKAAYLTRLKMLGVRFRWPDLSELAKEKDSPERKANRERYRRRVRAEAAKAKHQ